MKATLYDVAIDGQVCFHRQSFAMQTMIAAAAAAAVGSPHVYNTNNSHVG